MGQARFGVDFGRRRLDPSPYRSWQREAFYVQRFLTLPRQIFRYSRLMPKPSVPTPFSLATRVRITRSCVAQTRSMSSRLFSSQQTKRHTTPQLLPPHIPIEEELIPGYQADHFFPANPGDVLGGRFELKAKLGFGTSSTVWLARDKTGRLEGEPYVAVKICTSNAGDRAGAQHELEVSKRIIDCAHGDETKYEALLVVNDSFEVEGPCGLHLCLAIDLMREPLWLTRRRICEADKVTTKTLVIFKVYILNMLAGLQYLHDGCNIIHTGKSYNLPFNKQVYFNYY